MLFYQIFQSGFRPAVIASLLISLDYTKAYDTLDHHILSATLKYFGLDEEEFFEKLVLVDVF